MNALAATTRPGVVTPTSVAKPFRDQGGVILNHGGDNRGFHCHSIASRESKSAFVIMTNGDKGAELIMKVFESKILECFFTANA